MTPIVTVIVPMYQSAWSVVETLDSIRVQSLADFEALVINDGSTDEGPAIAQDYAKHDPRFRVIHQPNAGLAAARNTGLDAARGAFVYFLDADDRLAPRGLEWLVERAERDRAAAVFARVEWIDAAGHPTGWAPMLDHFEVGSAELLRACPFPVHAQLLRRDAVGGTRFDPALRIGEDWDFWLRLGERGVRWRGFDRVVASYRMSPASLSRDAIGMWRALSASVARAHSRAGATAEITRDVMNELAVEWATACAAPGDETSIRRAISLLQEARLPSVDPRVAASKAFHRLPWMNAMAPSCWALAPDTLLRPALAFWRALERHGLASDDLSSQSLRALAELAATPSIVARALAEHAAPTPVTLVGLGRNAKYIALELDRRSIPFTGADDRLQGPPAWAADLNLSFDVAPPDRVPASRRVILTMTDDAAAMERWHAHAPLRWSATHRATADRIHTLFGDQIAIIESDALRASV